MGAHPCPAAVPPHDAVLPDLTAEDSEAGSAGAADLPGAPQHPKKRC